MGLLLPVHSPQAENQKPEEPQHSAHTSHTPSLPQTASKQARVSARKKAELAPSCESPTHKTQLSGLQMSSFPVVGHIPLEAGSMPGSLTAAGIAVQSIPPLTISASDPITPCQSSCPMPQSHCSSLLALPVI